MRDPFSVWTAVAIIIIATLLLTLFYIEFTRATEFYESKPLMIATIAAMVVVTAVAIALIIHVLDFNCGKCLTCGSSMFRVLIDTEHSYRYICAVCLQ